MKESEAKIIEQLRHLQMLMNRQIFRSRMDGRGHNPHRGQGRVLSLLKIKPEISQRDMTYLLDMSKQSLAELLSKLEKNGYITREPSESDKRVMIVKLTEKGEKAVDDVSDRPTDMINIFEDMNEEELTVFSEYLTRIINKCEEQIPEGDFEHRRAVREDFMSEHGFGEFFGGSGGRSRGRFGHYGRSMRRNNGCGRCFEAGREHFVGRDGFDGGFSPADDWED